VGKNILSYISVIAAMAAIILTKALITNAVIVGIIVLKMAL
jgi:hypothetical protein